MGVATLPPGRLERCASVRHHIAELVNRPLNNQAPYVGSSAFAHKAGLHVSALAKAKDAHEHVDPAFGGKRTPLARCGRSWGGARRSSSRRRSSGWRSTAPPWAT